MSLTARVLAVAAVLGLPLIVAVAAGADDLEQPLLLGAMAGAIGRMLGTLRAGVPIVVGAAALSFVVGSVSGSPALVAVVFAAAGVAVGMSARWGLAAATGIAPIVSGFFTDGTRSVADSAVDATLVAIAGIWAFVVLEALVRRRLLPTMGSPHPVPPVDARLYAVVLGLAAGVGNGIVVALDVPHGAWVNLTLFIVAVPSVGDTVRKVVERSLGTIIGGALSILVADVLPWPDAWPIIAVLLISPMLLAMRDRYWLYTVFLTMVIVLGEAGSPDALVEADGYRVGLTVLTSAAILAIALALKATVLARRPTSRA